MFRSAQTGHDDPVDETPTGRSRPRNAAQRPDPQSAPPKAAPRKAAPRRAAPPAGAAPRVRRATKAAASATGEDTQASQAEPEEVTMSETVTEQPHLVPTQKSPSEPAEEHGALVVPSEK